MSPPAASWICDIVASQMKTVVAIAVPVPLAWREFFHTAYLPLMWTSSRGMKAFMGRRNWCETLP